MTQVYPYQIEPKKSLGQHFLVDETHLAHIVEAAELEADDVVLEIGPGLGNLTRLLAIQAGRVIAVELDDRLIELLRRRFANQPHVRVVHGDILQLNPTELTGNGSSGRRSWPPKYKVVANLPYYITSAVLRHLLEQADRPALAVVMVQKEVAERICAEPGQMSLLAVSVQSYAHPQIVHRTPANAFYPRPKVDSAVLRLDVYSQPLVTDIPSERFFAVVRAGFGQKRKQLLNSLSAGLALPKTAIQAALESVGINPKRRPEALSIEEWRRVCLALGDLATTAE